MNITQVKSKISELNRNLNSCNVDDIEAINNFILDLEATLLDKDFSLEQEHEISTFMEQNNMLPLFQQAYEIFETNLEIRFAKLISKSMNPREDFKKYLLYDRFVTLLNNEVNLAHLSKDDKVLFIGSGPIPITAILMHQLAKAKIVCVEKNSLYIELARKVIDRLNYSNFIEVVNKEGVDVDCSNYSVILIALLAKPKDLLLQTIWRKINKGVRIICRTSDSFRQAFYEKTDAELLNKYQPSKKIIATGNQTISSTLLVKI